MFFRDFYCLIIMTHLMQFIGQFLQYAGGEYKLPNATLSVILFSSSWPPIELFRTIQLNSQSHYFNYDARFVSSILY